MPPFVDQVLLGITLTDSERAVLAEERARYQALTGSIAAAPKGWSGPGIELVSIGDSAGSHNAAQGMPTGGFLLRGGGRSIIIDPGSNAFVFLRQCGIDPYEITDVAASHAHDDHVGDLSLAVSAAMSLGLDSVSDATIIVCPALVDYTAVCSTCFGFTLPSFAFDQSVVALSPLERHVNAVDGIVVDSTQEVTLANGFKVRATPTRHGSIEGVGFMFETPFGRLVYSGDTGYFPELESHYAGADVLWLNLNTLGLRGMTDTGRDDALATEPVANHLGYVGICRLIEAVKPSVAIISHFGAQLLGLRDRIETALRDRFRGTNTEILLATRGDVYRFSESLKTAPETGRLAR